MTALTAPAQESPFAALARWLTALAAVFAIAASSAGIVLGIRWLARQGRESRSDPALEILRQRYARGEINKEEFEARKRDLS